MAAPPRRWAVSLAALAAALILTSCGDSDATAGADGRGGGQTKLTVLAASSLTDVFSTAGTAYTKGHPDTKVTFSFAGSQELAAQVRQGAPADVLVTADTATMTGLGSATGTPKALAKNRLVIAVGKGNAHQVKGLGDLARKDLKVILAAPEVPVGRYSRQVLDAQKITVHPVSQEPNVRAVLSKVELGEADAGIVYITDAATPAARDKVDTVTIPDAQNAIASYPAAVLSQSKHRSQADAFVRWLTSDQALGILLDAGYQKP